MNYKIKRLNPAITSITFSEPLDKNALTASSYFTPMNSASVDKTDVELSSLCVEGGGGVIQAHAEDSDLIVAYYEIEPSPESTGRLFRTALKVASIKSLGVYPGMEHELSPKMLEDICKNRSVDFPGLHAAEIGSGATSSLWVLQDQTFIAGSSSTMTAKGTLRLEGTARETKGFEVHLTSRTLWPHD